MDPYQPQQPATQVAVPPHTDYAEASVEHVWPALSAQPPAPIRNRRPLWIALGVLAAALAVGLTLALTLAGSAQHPLTIEFGLVDADSDCSGGSGGYSDVGPGMPVTVRDQDNKIVASTAIPETGVEAFGCIWTMHVTVPPDADQYSVEGGRRGAVTFSREELEDNDWVAEISLGD